MSSSPSRPTPKPGQAPETSGRESKPSIVVIEDERNTRNALQRFLEREGWHCLGFANVAEATAWLNGETTPTARISGGEGTDSIGGAVIDVHLPDGDGIDLTRALREKLGPGVPIVIVSGDTSIETLRRLRNAGGNRFVGKPMSLQTLRDALTAPLDQSES